MNDALELWEACRDKAEHGEGPFQLFLPEVNASLLPDLDAIIESRVAISRITEHDGEYEDLPVEDGLAAAIERVLAGETFLTEILGTVGDTECTIRLAPEDVLITTDSDALFAGSGFVSEQQAQFRTLVALSISFADTLNAAGVYGGRDRFLEYDAPYDGVAIYEREATLADIAPNDAIGRGHREVSGAWSSYLSLTSERLIAAGFERIDVLPTGLEADQAYRLRKSRLGGLSKTETACFFGYAERQVDATQAMRFMEAVFEFAATERFAAYNGRPGFLRVYAVIGCHAVSEEAAEFVYRDQNLPNVAWLQFPVIVNFETSEMYFRDHGVFDALSRRGGVTKETIALFSPE